jgi:hypothetical protein
MKISTLLIFCLFILNPYIYAGNNGTYMRSIPIERGAPHTNPAHSPHIVYVMKASDINRKFKTTKNILLPAGLILLDEPIRIPGGSSLSGSPLASHGTQYSTRLVLPLHTKADTAIAFYPGKGAKALSRVSIVRDAEPPFGSPGIYIRSSDVTIDSVDIPPSTYGVQIDTSSSPNTNITLNYVNYDNANLSCNGQYGILVSDVETLKIIHCTWQHSILDGIKLRYKCHHILIDGGASQYNGYGLAWNPQACGADSGYHCSNIDSPNTRIFKSGNAGDGIDAYAGGKWVTIQNITLMQNGGNGITIKSTGGDIDVPCRPVTDSLHTEFCGDISNFTISGITTINNAGSGIAIEGVYDSTSLNYDTAYIGCSHPPKRPNLTCTEQDDRIRAHDITITGCTFAEDHTYGLFLNGTSISVEGCTIKSTCLAGIRIGENASAVSIFNCSALGCTRGLTHTHRYPVFIEEKAINCSLYNVYMDGISQPPVITGLPGSTAFRRDTVHDGGIYINETPNHLNNPCGLPYISANFIYIVHCTNINSLDAKNFSPGQSTTPAFLGDDSSSGSIFIDHMDTFCNPNKVLMAGRGSIYTDTVTGQVWEKQYDPPYDDGSQREKGWVKIFMLNDRKK